MEASAPAPPPTAGTAYPVRLEADRQDEYNRFLPLVKWLLAIPHYIVLVFVAIAALIAVLISFFATIITGRWPRGLFDFCVGALRWAYRVYAYVFLLTDQYPPFSLEHDPSYPLRVEIDYPEQVDRWRPLVQWLLILPYAIVAGILLSLAKFVAFIGIFVILFTAKLPEGMSSLIVNPLRWQLRTSAYSAWMATSYPPFDWEDPRI